MKKIIIFILLVLLVPIVSAEIQTLGTFKKGECVELQQTCANCTFVNISSVLYPNSTEALGEVLMTKNNTKYNHTFCNTNTSGEYIVNGFGDVDGTNTIFAYDFVVNPTGIPATESRTNSLTRSVYFIFGIGILLFGSFIFFFFYKKSPPVTWTFFIFSIIFFLIGLNIISVTLADEVVNPRLETFFDNFSAISWYFYYFSAGVLIIMWILTFMNTWIYQKNLRNAQKYG